MEKVKALWAKGDDPAATPEEAATFRDAAARLMAKYEIEQFELLAAGGGEDAIVKGLFKIDSKTDKGMFLTDERMLLAGAIARHFECRGIIKDYEYGTADEVTGQPIKPGTYYECIGYKHDFEMVRELYFSLVTDLFAGIFGEEQTNRNYQQEYARGFISRIDDRLKEFYKRVNDWVDDGTVSDSTALAIRSRLQKVQDKVTEMYPKLSTVKIKSTRVDPNARARGKARADMSDLGGHNKVGGGSGSAGSIGTAKKELGS